MDEEKGIARYVNFLMKWSIPVLLLFAVILALAVVEIFNVSTDTRYSLFTPSTASQSAGSDLLRSHFGGDSQLIILIPSGREPDEVREVSHLARRIEKLDGVSEVITPLPSLLAFSSDTEIRAYLASAPRDEGLPPFVDKCEYAAYQVMRVLIDTSNGTQQTVRAIREVLDEKAPGSVISGESVLENNILSYILQLLVFPPSAAVLALLLLFIIFLKSVKPAAAAILPSVLGGIFTLALLTLIFGSVSLISVLAPTFVIVLTAAGPLKLTERVLKGLSEGSDNRTAITAAVNSELRPFIAQYLIAAAAFLSLLSIDSSPLRQLGLGSAIGILLTGIVTWIILPILLSKQKPVFLKQKERNTIVVHTGGTVRAIPALLMSVVIIAVSVSGIMRVQSDFSLLDLHSPDTEVRTSVETVKELTGGAFPVTLLIESDDPYSIEAVTAVRTLEAASGFPAVSLYSLIASYEAEQRLPDDILSSPEEMKSVVKELLQLQPQVMDSFLSRDGETGKSYLKVIINLGSLDADLLSTIMGTSKQLSTGNLSVYPVGTSFEILQMNTMIKGQLFYSLLAALAATVCITALMLKSLRFALLSAVPAGMTLLAIFGVMGYTSIDITPVTAVGGAVAMGISYASSMYYLCFYRELHRRGIADCEREAVKSTAGPILSGALVIILGFTSLLISPVPAHTALALLLALSAVLSSLFSLMLFPAFLKK